MNPWLAAGAAAVLLFLLHRGGALPSAPTSDNTIPLTSSNAGPGGAAVALPPGQGEGGSSQGSADIGSGTDTQSSIVSTYTTDSGGSYGVDPQTGYVYTQPVHPDVSGSGLLPGPAAAGLTPTISSGLVTGTYSQTILSPSLYQQTSIPSVGSAKAV